MAEKTNRVTLVCEECKEVNYFTSINHKNVKDKLKIKKFCSRCKKHTVHKEGKYAHKKK